MQSFTDLLKKMDLFQGIETENLGAILKCLGARECAYKKDEVIWFAGDDNDSVGILLSGQLNLIKEDILGNRNIIAKIGPPNLFGEVAVCARLKETPLTVQAASPAQVLFIQIDRLINTCTNACAFHNRLVKNLLTVIAKNSLRLNEKIDYLHQKTIRSRLALYLVNQIAMQGKTEIVLEYNRDELADYLGVNRSALSRELAHLKEEGLLDYSRNRFTVKDVPRLNAFC